MPNAGVLSQKVANHVLTETVYALPTLLGLPKQLWSRRGRGVIEHFLRETPVFPISSSMRRFMDGEFTGGEVPFHFRATGLRHIEATLRALDVIDALAAAHDAGMGVELDRLVSEAEESVFHVERVVPEPIDEGFDPFNAGEAEVSAELERIGVIETDSQLAPEPIRAPAEPVRPEPKRRGRPPGSKNRVSVKKERV